MGRAAEGAIDAHRVGRGRVVDRRRFRFSRFSCRSSGAFDADGGVIFPSACYLRMFEDELTDNERVANWAIMLLGGFCVVAGSASAINATLDQF